MKHFASFREFYSFYLTQHANSTCRYLHVVGSLLGLAMAVYAILMTSWWLVPAGVVVGYAFSWTGHFVFEKNKPATFNWPWYSFLGDWVMAWETITGHRPTSLTSSNKAH